jgi:hypothetical protein
MVVMGGLDVGRGEIEGMVLGWFGTVACWWKVFPIFGDPDIKDGIVALGPNMAAIIINKRLVIFPRARIILSR